MYMTKLKAMAAGLACLLAVGLGVGGAATRLGAGQGNEEAAPREVREVDPPKAAEELPPRKPEEDLAKLVGTWKVTDGRVTFRNPGMNDLAIRKFTPAELRSFLLKVDSEGTFTFSKGGVGGRLTFVAALTPTRTGGRINLYPLGADEDKCLCGVYRIDGDELSLAVNDMFHFTRAPDRVGAVTSGTGRYMVLQRVQDEKESAPPKKAGPPATDGRFAERFGGTWRVDAATRGGKPLTAWERRGYLLGFSPDGKLTMHRGNIAGHREFAFELDTARHPEALVLTPAGTKRQVRVTVAPTPDRARFVLSWYDTPDGTAPERQEEAVKHSRTLTLSRYGSSRPDDDRPLGLRVDPSTGNLAASRLAGTWTFDGGLTRRLTAAPADWPAPKFKLEVRSNPAVARQVPATYRELLGGKRIYLSGQMTLSSPDKSSKSHPFVMIEHEGNPVLVYFETDEEGRWTKEAASIVVLVPGESSSTDLLCLSALDDEDKGMPTTAFQREADR